MAPRKASFHKEYVDTLVSYSSRLLQFIKQILQLAYTMLSTLLHKPLMLLKVDYHVQFVIQECGLDVHLMHLQARSWTPLSFALWIVVKLFCSCLCLLDAIVELYAMNE